MGTWAHAPFPFGNRVLFFSLFSSALENFFFGCEIFSDGAPGCGGGGISDTPFSFLSPCTIVKNILNPGNQDLGVHTLPKKRKKEERKAKKRNRNNNRPSTNRKPGEDCVCVCGGAKKFPPFVDLLDLLDL